MAHPAELALTEYMKKASAGESTISDTTVANIAKGVADSVQRQFGGQSERKGFKLRMSNIGRPSCQLWWQKNHPSEASPLPYNFIMNMVLGDVVEVVFKALLDEANISYKDSDTVEFTVPGSAGEDSTKVKGTYDIVIDGKVDDIKSASSWSYTNKFASFDTLNAGDAFGYVGQLVAYASASGYDVGGWWVVNKANGEFKYVPAEGVNVMETMYNIKKTVHNVNNDILVREYEPVYESFNGKKTGNTVLDKNCSFCSYKKSCWPSMTTLPSIPSKAKNRKMVDYVTVVKSKEECNVV
jgi:hypothetical protein